MKKKIFILLFLLFIPFIINADLIDSISFEKTAKAVIGSETKVSVNIKYSFMNSKKANDYGIIGYTYQLDFDNDVLVPTKIEEDSYFDKKIYIDENNKYHLIAVFKKDNKSNNKCKDNILYCFNVKDTIYFGIKDTSLANTSVKIYAVNTYLYKINSQLNEEDKSLSDSKKSVTQKIILEKSDKSNVKFTNIAKKIKTKEIDNIINSRVEEYKLDSNTNSNSYLSNLEINGYDIDFDKHILSYDLNVESSVNSLEITAESENISSIVTIVGADDLKANDYVVEITVTSKDNTTKTYKINVNKEETKEDEEVIETQEDIKKFVHNVKKKVDNNVIQKLKIAGICALGVILLIVFIKSLTNRKLNKKLKDFDKF